MVGEGNMVGDRGGVGVWRWRIFISNCSLSAIYYVLKYIKLLK